MVEVAYNFTVHACTDVTVWAHGIPAEMASASNVTIHIKVYDILFWWKDVIEAAQIS